jgi:hypothetical protein
VIIDGELVMPPGANPAEYQKAIGQATGAALGPAVDGYPAVTGMFNRYQVIVTNPNPHG